MQKKLMLILGPNLNMVGTREKGVYGSVSAEDINKEVTNYANNNGCSIEIYQSNHEGEIIDKIHSSIDKFDGVIINAGALTHYSYALRDAISSIETPFIEVHMSNVHKREEFRHKSVITAVCTGVIAGFGKDVYKLAIQSFLM